MALREIIEAILRVKDANRFKQGFEGAARSVRKFGRAEEEAAAQTEILTRMEAHAKKQTEQLTAILAVCGAAYDEMGDDALSAAAKITVANRAMKKSGSNAVFLGKSWAFWKDRLSLTRSEIMTTALTIGAYFAPAIIALGNSFVYAAMGGGAVAGAGLASLVTGLVLLSTVVSPAINGIKKIKKAQDQYNLAIDQYGAASIQASRANAHLYAVIQNNGGPAAARALSNIERLTSAWKTLTTPARKDALATIGAGAQAAQNIAPFAAAQVNNMAKATRLALQGAMKDITGSEGRKTLGALGDIFSSSIGFGVRGVTNLLIVMGRAIRAAAPWVKRFAQSFAELTSSWRRRATFDRVEKFLNGAVESFRSWWGLARELGRTLGILFRNSRDEGQSIVIVLTNLIRKFNDWLQRASDTGAITEFWKKYNKSVSDAVWALQHPVEAINRWLPRIMDAIANNLATHAPAAANVFINAFMHAGGWAQFLTVAFLLKKFGVFKKLGALVGASFVLPFVTAFSTAFVTAIGIDTAAGGTIGKAMAAAGSVAGKIFGRTFGIAALAAFALSIAYLATRPSAGGKRDPKSGVLIGPHGAQYAHPLKPSHHRQFGGAIPAGTSAIVGEAGQEIATATRSGTQITPIGRNGSNPIFDMPDLSNTFRMHIYTSVQVDRREIARAYDEQVAFNRGRKGG